jgi:hypothetical protein
MHTFDLRVRNPVRIQPIGSEGLSSAADAPSWRDDASLVQVISGAKCFQLHKLKDVVGGFGKFFKIN